jgi:hypothetical protein
VLEVKSERTIKTNPVKYSELPS